eukprot:Platyproteum_vivax@DN3968_c0_g1_i2.p2
MIQVDGPSAFYTDTNQYTARTTLHHKIMVLLGWNIRRVRWYDWIELKNPQEKHDFLKKLRAADPLPAALLDPTPVSTEHIKACLEKVKAKTKMIRQKQLAPKITIDFSKFQSRSTLVDSREVVTSGIATEDGEFAIDQVVNATKAPEANKGRVGKKPKKARQAIMKPPKEPTTATTVEAQ